ncbi:MAG: protoporphyrinogen oxidase [Planctomycetota bacterium]|jgi:protoporphyrinogen oxidase
MLAGCGASAGQAGAHITGGLVDDHSSAGHRLRQPLGSFAPQREERAHVLVVGAGVAGLAAAWRMQRAGLEGVRVIELAQQIGGTSAGGEMAGLRHPWGAHYLPVPRASQRHLVAQLQDLGLIQGIASNGRLQVANDQLVRAPAERVHELGYWREGLWPAAGSNAEDSAQLQHFEELLSAASAVDGAAARSFQLPLAQCSKAQRDLDKESAADWAARHGLDRERLRWYLEYATRDDFGASLEDTSAFALLHYFLAREDTAGEGAEFLTWPEGNARLVEGMAAGLKHPASTGQLALRVEQGASGATVDAIDLASGDNVRWQAEHVVLALPQFINARLLAEDPARAARQSFRYSPWVVANLHLSEPPTGRGFPPAWDNVLRNSDSLGYVNATHQLDRDHERDTIWSWYLPIIDSDERAARTQLLASTFEQWRDVILSDLTRPHAGLADYVTRIEVRRWGHAMVKPVPGFLWGSARAEAAQPIGRVHFAHSDLSGMALYEEAHWQGVRAAEEVLVAAKQSFETLLG